MHSSRYLKFPLLLAAPFLLAACAQQASPDGSEVDPSAPPAMAAGGTSDASESRGAAAGPDAPVTPTPPSAPVDAAPAESGPNAPADAAQPAGDAPARIERVLGDADQYETVFKALQQGVASGDRAAVAKLMRYPLRANVGGKQREIADAATFQKEYERIMTAPVTRAIGAQAFDTVFVNQQGVMIGNGQAWLNGTCLDQACSRSDVKVVTLQD